MPTSLSLTAQPREIVGKQVSQLRRSGLTPANIYGPGLPSTAIQVETRLLQRIVDTAVGRPIQLTIGQETRTVRVQQVQKHPVTGGVWHVDFYQPR